MKRKKLFTGALLTVVLLSAFVGGGYAIFTDTESKRVYFEAGTIDIALSGEDFAQAYLDPAEFDDWKPGDEEDFDLVITNTGENKAWIQIYIYKSPHWSIDRLDFWDVATLDVDVDHPGDWNRWVLDTEDDDSMQVTLKVGLPQWVGNDYQGAQGDLMILVVAKQWRNKFEDGYSCVALENKDSDEPWLPHLDDDLEGIVCYKADGDKLLVDVNGYGLIPGKYYQLTLNGTGGGPSCDNFEDVSFAGMPGDLYISGWYRYLPTMLHSTCTEDWHEGVYNFTGTYGEVQASGTGSISWGGVISDLPYGLYDQVKFMVKEIGGFTGDAPGPGNEGNSWVPKLMEMDYLSFSIPSTP